MFHTDLTICCWWTLGCFSIFWQMLFFFLIFCYIAKLFFILPQTRYESWWAIIQSSFSLFFFLISSRNHTYAKLLKNIYLWRIFPTYVLRTKGGLFFLGPFDLFPNYSNETWWSPPQPGKIVTSLISSREKCPSLGSQSWHCKSWVCILTLVRIIYDLVLTKGIT